MPCEFRKVWRRRVGIHRILLVVEIKTTALGNWKSFDQGQGLLSGAGPPLPQILPIGRLLELELTGILSIQSRLPPTPINDPLGVHAGVLASRRPGQRTEMQVLFVEVHHIQIIPQFHARGEGQEFVGSRIPN